MDVDGMGDKTSISWLKKNMSILRRICSNSRRQTDRTGAHGAEIGTKRGYALEKAKETTFARFLYALGILKSARPPQQVWRHISARWKRGSRFD